MKNNFMNAMLVHIGTNLWYEEGNTKCSGEAVWKQPASSKMRFDLDFFHEYTKKLSECGVNTLVLDLADGIVYNSHPEIAIEGSLSREALEQEIARLRNMGFEIIPKLNLSACHDYWLKDYARMVSTEPYYAVCRDLIHEVCEIFKPKYFHLGMDEENYENQMLYDYVTVRQNDLWWGDLYFFINCVEECGARAVIWSDYARNHPDEFVKKCPKSVLQCPWYYFNIFDEKITEEYYRMRLLPFRLLEEHGFDQFAGASNEYFPENFKMLKQYCKEVVSDEHFYGILQTTWKATIPENRKELFEAAELIKDALEI